MNVKFRNNLSGSMSFKSFIPHKIEDYELIEDEKSNHLIAELHEVFAKLNHELVSVQDDIANALVVTEATDSWRLSENKPQNPFALYSYGDNKNVESIVRATDYGVSALVELPLSSRLLRNIHYLICAGTDYDKKYRGEFRKSPVWIGAEGCEMADALFIPPVVDDMIDAITDLENYINYSDNDVFVKAAIIHYQFEMIHPFIDANGRSGRLLNNLFLYEAGKLACPTLLLSHIIGYSYKEYCETMQSVNETSDINIWLRYYLTVLNESANYTLNKLRDMNPRLIHAWRK